MKMVLLLLAVAVLGMILRWKSPGQTMMRMAMPGLGTRSIVG